MGCSSSHPIRLPPTINKKPPETPVTIRGKTGICTAMTAADHRALELNLRRKADQSGCGPAASNERATAAEKALPCRLKPPGRVQGPSIRRREVSSRGDILRSEWVKPSPVEEPPLQPQVLQPYPFESQNPQTPSLQPLHLPPSPPPHETDHEHETPQPQPHLPYPQPRRPTSWLISQPQPDTSPVHSAMNQFLSFPRYLQIRETYHTCFIPTPPFGLEVGLNQHLPEATTDDLAIVFNIVHRTTSTSSDLDGQSPSTVFTVACPGRDIRKAIEKLTSGVGAVAVVRYGDETVSLEELPVVLGLGRRFWVEVTDAETGVGGRGDTNG
jgi:hypothetical protein